MWVVVFMSPVKNEMKMREKTMNFKGAFTWLRLSLGGAVLGIAIASLVDAYFGLHHPGEAQSFGALAGTVAAATLVKLVHLV